ncbi:MAG: hypothetical protein WD226_04475 [Planctomycetota bacterium]
MPTLWLLGAAALLRIAHAYGASLQLDDFHTLHHAAAPTWRAFLESLRADNHPPLVPGLVRALGFVASPVAAFRALQLVVALALVVWTGRVAERLGGRRVRYIAEALVAFSALHVELSTDLRMYGALALAGLALLDVALRIAEQRARWFPTVLIVAFGLHVHYHFVHALAGTLLVVAGAYLTGRLARPAVLRFAGGVLVGFLCFLPWGVYGFWHQVFGHSIAPGSSHVDLMRFVQGLVHLLFHRTALLGPFAWVVYAPIAIAGMALAALGVARASRPKERCARGWLLGWASFGVVAWSAVAALLSDRAGFEWRYLAGALAPFAIALALGIARLPGRAAPLIFLTASALLAGRLALDPGRENYRDAVAAIVADVQPNDAVLAADWQPTIFPRAIGWNWYAPRLTRQDLPTRIDHTQDFALVDERLPFERIRVLTRSVPAHVPFFRQLEANFERTAAHRYGEAIWLVTYRRRGSGPVQGR